MGDESPEIGGRWVLAIAGPALDGSRPAGLSPSHVQIDFWTRVGKQAARSANLIYTSGASDRPPRLRGRVRARVKRVIGVAPGSITRAPGVEIGAMALPVPA